MEVGHQVALEAVQVPEVGLQGPAAGVDHQGAAEGIADQGAEE